MAKTLSSKVLLPALALLAGMAVSSALAQPVVPEQLTVVACDWLPAKDEFVKTDYDVDTLKKIQQCLKVKGFFNAPVHGVKGPKTIAALEKYHAKKAASAPAPSKPSPLPSTPPAPVPQPKPVVAPKVAPATPKPAKIDCNKLPSKELFMKQQYSADTIRVIQGCLAAKGYYKGAVDGLKGSALIDALSKAQAVGAALK
jgi:hypothetical protein